MKLERSDTWTGTGRPVWRVTSWYFAWGPWCHTKLDAIRQWRRAVAWSDFREFLAMPFIRLWRWRTYLCLPCGRSVGSRVGEVEGKIPHFRYCSMECAAYDGALKDPKKSWVLYGRLTEQKRHYEADMKGDE